MTQLNIGIILGSTREGRVSPQVGEWIRRQAELRGDALYEILDIKTFGLPLLGETADNGPAARWAQTLAKYDGFVFIVSEYNHSMSGALKNALDSAKAEWANKAAGIVSYGSVGGARAAEHVRQVLGELQVADVRTQVLFSGFSDFENWSVFKPSDLHKKNLGVMLDQLLAWSKALKSLR